MMGTNQQLLSAAIYRSAVTQPTMHFLCEFHPRGKKEIVQPGVVDKGGIRAHGTQCYQFNSWGEEKDQGGGGGKGRINVGGGS